MTMRRMKDYKGKEGSRPREGKKSTTGRKEDDHGMDERLPSEGIHNQIQQDI